MIVACSSIALLAGVGEGATPGSGEAAGWLVPVAAFALGALVCLVSRRASRAGTAAAAAAEAAIPTYREAARAFERELERARRNDRRLSVLVVRLDDDAVADLEAKIGGGANGSGNSEMLAKCTVQAAYTLAGSILREHLREIDLATSDAVNRRYVVALPESDAAKATETGRRMADLVHRGTGVRVRFGVAEFKKDGVLMEDLVGSAARTCGEVGAREAWKTPAAGVVRPKSSQLPSPG